MTERHILIVSLIFLIGLNSVHSVSFKTIYNPFTSKLDYYNIDTNLTDLNASLNNQLSTKLSNNTDIDVNKANFDGTVTFQSDTIFFDNITLVMGNIVNGSMNPAIDNLFTIGNSSYKWKSGNFSGNVQAGNIIAGNGYFEDTSPTVTITPTTGGVSKESQLYLYRTTGAGTQTLSASLVTSVSNIYLSNTEGGNLYLRSVGGGYVLLNPAGGNVGIGTAVPNALLDVRGSATFNEDGTDSDFRIETDTNANHFVSDAGLFSGKGAFGIGSAPLTGDRAYIYFAPPTLTSTATATSVEHFLADPQGLTIDGGAVTTSATMILREPTLTLANSGTVNDAYTFVIQSAPTEGTRNGALWVGSGISRFDGSVGIGGSAVANPALRLQVKGIATGAVGLPVTSGTAQSGNIRLSTGSNNVLDMGGTEGAVGQMWLQAGDATDLSIEYPLLLNPNGGNIGIGVTAPDVKLDISGETKIDGNLRIEGTSSELRLIQGRNIYVNSTENSADANIFVSQAGVGDFSSEAGHLILQPRVQGTVYRDIIFASGLTRGNSIMRITGEGNVGIGTSTPISTLEVIGTANASIIKGGDYYSGDGTQGFTGSCASTTTLTVKDGLITACA